MLTVAETNQLIALRKFAEEKGREDVVAQVDVALKKVAPDDILPGGGRQLEIQKENQKQHEDYLELKRQQEILPKFIEFAKERGREDIVEKALITQKFVQSEIKDYEDVTEEIRGAGAAALEGLSGGIFGDEAQAWAISGITGADYDKVLEDTRRVQKEFAEDFPALDLGIRIATGILPSAMLSKAVGVGTTLIGGALRQGGLATGELGVYSFMEGEGGAEQRLQNVAETFQDPLVLGAVGLAGGVGALGGLGVGRLQALEKSVADAIEKEEKNLRRLRTSAEQGVGTEVTTTSQTVGDLAVIRFYNQNGRMPEGTEITQIYREIADETGIPLGRIIQSEMKGGKKKSDLDYREQDIETVRSRAKIISGEEGFVPVEQTITTKGQVYDKYFRPIVEVAKKRISKAAGGNFQRMATNMARQQQYFDEVLTSKPVAAFAKRLETDASGKIKQRILNFSNSKLKGYERRREFNELKKMLKEEEMEGLRTLLKLRVQQANEYRKYIYSALPVDPLYLPSQSLSEQNAVTFLRFKQSPRKSVDVNMMERTRGYLTAAEARNYENPLIILRNKLAHDEALIQMHKNFGLENTLNRLKTNPEKAKEIRKEIEQGDASFILLEEAIKKEGGSKDVIALTDELARSLIVRGSQSPKGWLANIRKMAYMGTIGNPYSALLNFGDVSNTVVNFGADNTAAGVINYFKNNGLATNVKDVGLANQATGDFLREGGTAWNRRFNQFSDLSFKAAGFRGADVAGKTVTLNAAIQRGRQLAADGTLAREYGWLFNKGEINSLRRDLLAGRKTDRVREFAAAELAKLQPSDLAQMPKWYLDHPNGRLLYMLRTFGLKQLQQIERLVLETWKEGARRNDNAMKAKAIKNAAAYLVVVGGGNTLLNELRQPIKGKRDAFEMEDMQEYFVDFMLGVATLNTLSSYNLKRASEGDAGPLIMSVFPAPVGMAEDFAADTIQLLSGEEDLEDLIEEGKAVRWLPFMRIIQPYLD